MDQRDKSAELKAAFLHESSSDLPGTVWREAEDDVSVKYPQESPALGTLTVGFGWDEITVFVGRRGYHAHFSLDESPSNTEHEQTTETARRALLFVRDVVGDRLSLRWGLLVSGAHSVRRGTTAAGRVWKWLTPWVQEAVWSGRSLVAVSFLLTSVLLSGCASTGQGSDSSKLPPGNYTLKGFSAEGKQLGGNR
jgi:hypothetical protein